MYIFVFDRKHTSKIFLVLDMRSNSTFAQILDHILCMGDAELPLLVIVDSVSGVFAVCEEEDVSRSVTEDILCFELKTTKLNCKVLFFFGGRVHEMR